MKHFVAVSTFVLFACFSTLAFAADKVVISKNVDEVVAGIDGGKDASSFAADAYTPYVFVLMEDGKMLVHPSLTGANLKEKAMPIYEALKVATPEGSWVQYEWKGKEKNTYMKKTKSGLIVASGY